MPFRRRRPLARAAVVGGVAYHAGKKVQEGRDEQAAAEYEDYGPPEPPAPTGGLSDEALAQLEKLAKLNQQGILTDEEFEEQKRKLLAAT